MPTRRAARPVRPTSWVLTTLMLGAAAPRPGAAQITDECQSAATDSLAAARRARSALADRALYQRRVDDRFAALVAADAEHAIEDGAVLQFVLIDQTNAIEGYSLCGAAGGAEADLTGGWTGIGVEWRTTDGQWLVAASLIGGGDSLSPSDFTADEQQSVSPDAVGHGYVFWLLEVRLTDWASVGYGQITDARVRHSLGEDSSGATASNSEYLTHGQPRHAVQLGVPRLALTAGVVIGDALDFGELAVAPLPLPWVPGLELGGMLRRLGDESLVVTGVEAAWPLLDGRVRPSLDAALAWPDSRLRVARLRVEGAIGGVSGGPVSDMPSTLGWAHAGASAWVEASRFDSAAVERADGEAALGVAAGIAAQVGVRGGELEVSGFAAQNRVSTLERLPDAGGRLEYGLGLLFRLGW